MNDLPIMILSVNNNVSSDEMEPSSSGDGINTLTKYSQVEDILIQVNFARELIDQVSVH